MPEIIPVPPGESLQMAPTASGFAHGFGLFETMRYAAGELHFWNDHWSRLSRSADVFGLPLPQETEVVDGMRRFVEQADLMEGTLKLSLLKVADDSQLFLYLRPALPAPPGRRLWLDRDAPILERSPLAGHKTHNYMEAMHRLGLARAAGYYDALRLDSRGRLAETTTANIFFVSGGSLCTPAEDTGILPGVTRAALLRSPELEIEEGNYSLDVLASAEALFVTNATSGVQAIEGIEGAAPHSRIDFDTEHPALEKMLTAYRRSRQAIRLR